MLPDPKKVLEKLYELLGGPDEFWKYSLDEHELIVSLWEQDTGQIGRILRAHLFVEHWLNEYLRTKNPNLGSLEKARLSFAQKVDLVGDVSSGISYLMLGIRRLNAIRNRLGHSLTAEISDTDGNIFLEIGLFRAMRDEGAKPKIPSTDPVDIIEDFAKHVGLVLQSIATGSAEIWAEAFRLANEDEELSDK